jgi:Glucose-1-phosphate thymidylyltransferase (EC 2.7.7.24)
MKAVILAGGSGTRLYPVTLVVNKHLLPIYNKPMIYYPLSLVMLLKIKEVALIVNPQDKEQFERLLGDGSHLGISISYIVQESPKGLAEGLVLGKNFLANDKVFYLLGDNILFGHNLPALLEEAMKEVEEQGVLIALATEYQTQKGLV